MLLNVEQLQERTGISQFTWRALIRRGLMPHVRIGRLVRVRDEDFESFIAARRIETAIPFRARHRRLRALRATEPEQRATAGLDGGAN